MSTKNRIIARRRTEEALPKSGKLSRAIIEHSYEAFTILSSDGTIMYDSPSMTRILGYAP